MSRDVYIYYRVAPARAKAAARAADQLLRTLAPHCNAPPQRRVRCDDPGTWMEIYPGVGDWTAFETALSAHGAELAGLVEGERYVECFVAVAGV